MKFLQYISTLLVAICFFNTAQASSEAHRVPFYNVEIKEASKIYINYSFDAHKQVLECREVGPNDAINTMEWEYKGARRMLDLPVTLKDDKNFNGYYADPEGQITITNDFGSSNINDTSIYVTCEYKQGK